MRLVALVPAVAGAVVLLAACGGDDDGPNPTLGDITPVGTKETPTTGPTDGGAGPPAPADPQLSENITEAARGELEAVVPAGGTYPIDGVTLTQDASGSAPPCANFQFSFAWQVTDPYPPSAVELLWQFTRQESTFEVANGPAGSQSVGCGLLEAVNNSQAPVTVAVKWAAGGLLQ